MRLRDYQQAAIDTVFAYFAEHTGNPIIAMPTGTGKSLVIAGLLKNILFRWPGQRVMILTHVKELVEQNHAKLLALWPTAPAGVFSAGLKRKDASAPILFGGVGSVGNSLHLFGRVDLLLIDECHLVSPKEETTYRKIIDHLLRLNPYLKVIGLTATPYRLGSGLLTEGGLFTDVCYDTTGRAAFNRLIADGYLSMLIPKRTGLELDASQVRVQGGEYVLKELQAAVDRDDITARALKELIQHGADREHWLIFATGVEHSLHIAEQLNALGVATVAIHSKMTDLQRDAAVAGFRAGLYRAAVNNNILTTGFDFPDIDLIGVLRPTKSTGLWVQMLGRGTRPAPGKRDCLVLDFAGNTAKLGPINDPVIPRRKGKKTGAAPVRCCDTCGTYNHASARFCISCGAIFEHHVHITATASMQELIADGLPQVEVFKVERVTYSPHSKIGKPPSIRAAYYSGLRKFDAWICLEHGGFPAKKAREWWRTATGTEPPETTAAALERCSELKVPTHIRVWLNKKNPEVLAYDYSGTGFATTEQAA